MSAQHMPGKLQVAVEVFDNDGCPETVIQGMGGAASVAVALDFGPNNPGMRYANARRLVACWNVCEGLSTESLERLGTLDRARVELDVILVQAIAQRDKLLAEFDAYKEGSEEAFRAVVEKKRDLEASEARMRQTIDGQQAVIVRMRKQRDELVGLCSEWVAAWDKEEFDPSLASRMRAAIAKVKAE